MIVGTSRRVGLLGSLLVLTLAVSCGAQPQHVDFVGRAVDPSFKVDPAPLTGANGKATTLGPDDSAKPLRLAFFGYTHCVDICPAVLGSLAAGLTRLRAKDRTRVQVYFVTTDPAHDTELVLREYLARFGTHFAGLSGRLPVIARVAESVGIFVDSGAESSNGTNDPSAHSTYVIAIGRDGRAPAFWNAETAPSQFASDIRFLLNGKS